jgi:hypothetical protein
MNITLSDNELRDLLAELVDKPVTDAPTLSDSELAELLTVVTDVLDDDDLTDDINELLDNLNM